MTHLLGLVLALAPAYLLRFHIFGLPTTGLEILIAGFLIATCFRLQVTEFSKIKGKINYAIGLFVLAGIISVAVATDQIKALGQFKAFILEPVLMFYAIHLTINGKQLQIPLRWLFASATVISLFGILQYFSFLHLPIRFWGTGEEVTRITSFFEYPNALSLYLAPLIGLFFTLAISNFELIKNKWVEWAGIAVMGTALLLTFSRGSWIALTLTLLFILIHKFGFKKVVIPVSLLVLLLVFIPSVQERLSVGVSDASSSAHLDLLKSGTEQIIEHPIFGLGLGGFGTINQTVNYPHNIALNFWVEMGILGLISFIWIILLAFEEHKNKTSVLTLAAAVSLMIVLIHGLVDAPYFKNDLALLFWFVIGLFYLSQDKLSYSR